MQNNLLINGKLVAGEGEAVPVFNPATGEEIVSIALHPLSAQAPAHQQLPALPGHRCG